VKKIRLSLVNPDEKAILSVRNIVAEGNLMASSYEELQQNAFPFVDKYGQYMHKEWKGKIHNEDELKANIEREKKELIALPSTRDWNKYGGWAKGKKFEATGHFRVEKALERHSMTWEDDYCIGYLVDNELHGWGSIGAKVLTSPSSDNAKVELLKYLTDKYQKIDLLNSAWSSHYKAWESLLNSGEEVNSKTALHDLLSFEKIIINKKDSFIRNPEI
jgi:hypothetical protein